MKDQECVDFLQWALPQLYLRWQGFRRVRGQVCKRVQQRLQELELPDTVAYRGYLEHHAEEWTVLDACCRITISRFYRDRSIFECLYQQVLPTLAEQALTQHEQEIRIWSAGCASGEEAYTLNILWKLAVQPQFPHLSLQILATDVNPQMLERAMIGYYDRSSLKELPSEYWEVAFEQLKQQHCVNSKFREHIHFIQQDIRLEIPEQSFHLICCRNLVFTYFDEPLQRVILQRIVQRLQPGGFLILGKHEHLPSGFSELIPYSEHIYRRDCDKA